MAAHRYWRVTITASTSGATNLISPYAMELRATAGGADQCYNGTSSASHSVTNIYKLYDHNNSTYYNNSSPSETCWVQYQMGAGNDIEVFELWFLPRYSSQMPKDFTLEYSDDGSSFTTLQSWIGEESWTGGVGKAFALPGMPVANQWSLNYNMPEPADPAAIARYWRIYVTATVSTNHSYYEIEMRATSGGIDLCTGGSASASHNSSTAYKAFNDNGGDYWISGVSGVDQWIQYDFGAGNEVNIKEIALKPREWYYAPKNFSLQYSFDGVEYFEVAEWLNVTEGWSPWEWAAFKVPGPIAQADWALAYDLSLSTGWSLQFDDAALLDVQWSQPYQIGVYADKQWDLPYATQIAVGWSLPYADKIYHNAQWSLPFGVLVEKAWVAPYTESTDGRWDLQYGLSVENEWNLPWIRSIDQSWTLPLYETVRQDWSLSYSLNHAISQQWSNPFTQTNSVSRQWPLEADLLSLNHVSAQWICFWELALPPSVTTTNMDVTFNHQGVTVGIGSVKIGIAEDEAAWTGTVEISDQAGFHQIRVNDEVSLTLGDETYSMLIDNRELSRSGGAKPRMLVRLVSVTANLASPRSQPFERTWSTATQAKDAAEEAVGQSIEWDLLDWLIPADRLSFFNASPIDAVKAIAQAAGGVVETSPGGSLRVRHRFPIAVPDWSTSTPSHILSDTSHNLSIQEKFIFKTRVNQVAIREFQPTTGQIATNLDNRDEDGLNPDGQPSMIPGSSPGLLVHTGPSVEVSDMESTAGTLHQDAIQIYQEETDLLFDWSDTAKLSTPARSLDSWTWMGNDLGELTLGSDGITVTAVSSGLAIARLKFTIEAEGWRLQSPPSLGGTTTFPIHLKVTGENRDTQGEEGAIFQRGDGEFPGPDIVAPLLTGLLPKQSRAQAEIDAGESLQEVSLTCIFISGIMPGQLVEVHDAMMGRSWRGKVTSVAHEVNGIVLTTALELIRYVAD
jgi:hypothetical protein